MNVICFHNPDEENGFLSNWYSSHFLVNDNKFTSMEQYMMYKKAVTFNDEKIANEILSITVNEDIPYCHKIALCDIPKGKEVIKYGNIIGVTDIDIKKGDWVSHKNIHSIPRDYASEYVKEV